MILTEMLYQMPGVYPTGMGGIFIRKKGCNYGNFHLLDMINYISPDDKYLFLSYPLLP